MRTTTAALQLASVRPRLLRIPLLMIGALLLAGPVHAHGGNHPLPLPQPVPGPNPFPPPHTGPGPRPIPPRPQGTGSPSPVTTPGPTPATTGTAAAAASSLAPTGLSGGTGIDLTSWTFWWRFNAEPFLAIKEHLYADGAVTGAEDFYLGQGSDEGDAETMRPNPGEIELRVVPALLHAMERGGHNDVVTGAMIALARIGRSASRDTRERIGAALEGRLDDGNQEIAETAALSLGILGRDRSVPLLADLLRDTAAGRKLVGGAVDTRTRAFAAYALGLIANRSEKPDVRRYAVIQLQAVLADEEEPRPDVGVACVLALGIVPLEEAGLAEDGAEPDAEDAPPGTLEAQVRGLLELLDDDRGDRTTRAHVPVSLARLVTRMRGANAEALRAEVGLDLVRRLSPRTKEPREVIQGCVVALGQIGDDDGDALDERIRKTLIAVPDATSDLLARHLALISAGQVGGRRGVGEAPGRIEVRRFLVKHLVRGNSNSRSWSALALALLGRGVAAGGEVPSSEVGKAVRGELESARAPLDVGGAAIAAGLLRDPAAGEELLDRLDRLRDDEARGYVAVGLGLLEERRAVAPLQVIVAHSTYHPVLLQDVAIGLALLRDRGALPDLVRMLGESRSLASQASVAAAMGRIGDRRAVDPLLGVLSDEELTALARAFAAVALGHVGDRDALPWSTVYAVGANYGAAPPTLFSPTGGGLLNIL